MIRIFLILVVTLIFANSCAVAQKSIVELDKSSKDKFDKGDFDGAISDYTEIIKINPKFAAAYYNRANARNYKKDLDGAIADYTKSIELDPNDVGAYHNRGTARIDKKDFNGAISDLTKAIEMKTNTNISYRSNQGSYQTLNNKDLALSYKNRAEAYRALNKIELAEADEKKVTELEK